MTTDRQIVALDSESVAAYYRDARTAGRLARELSESQITAAERRVESQVPFIGLRFLDARSQAIATRLRADDE